MVTVKAGSIMAQLLVRSNPSTMQAHSSDLVTRPIASPSRPSWFDEPVAKVLAKCQTKTEHTCSFAPAPEPLQFLPVLSVSHETQHLHKSLQLLARRFRRWLPQFSRQLQGLLQFLSLRQRCWPPKYSWQVQGLLQHRVSLKMEWSARSHAS